MIEFEAGSPSSKLIGLLFQDSQDNTLHPLEDRKKSATLTRSFEGFHLLSVGDIQAEGQQPRKM